MGAGWADAHVADLREGRTVRFRPSGHSMPGYVPHRALVEVRPLDRPPEPGQVVLCRVGGRQYLHLVRAVDGERVQIGNARGRVNGWTAFAAVYGVCVAVDRRPARGWRERQAEGAER